MASVPATGQHPMTKVRSFRRAASGAFFFASLSGAMSFTASAQSPSTDVIGRDSVTVVAGPDYAAGGFHRKLLGDNYRDAWTTSIKVPVLDLKNFAGGLTPTK